MSEPLETGWRETIQTPPFSPIVQTQFGKRGNCWQACASAITGIPLSAFPDIHEEHEKAGWWNPVVEVLRAHGWTMTMVTKGYHEKPLAPIGFSIAGGPSPRAEDDDHPGHSVVYLNGEPYHDPHPDQSFLAGPVEEFYLLIPTLEVMEAP